MNELVAAICAHINLNWDALKRISLSCLEIVVVLQTNFVPLVSLDTGYFSGTNKSAVRHPSWCYDTAAYIRRAAVTAIVSFWVVQVAVAILYVLTARLIFQVVS